MSNLGMVQWVLNDFDVACVVTMYGMFDTLVMLKSTNKSRSHSPSFVISMNAINSDSINNKAKYFCFLLSSM